MISLISERAARLKEVLGDPPPQRIAILRALVLGDLLCSVPALRALRHALPATHITLIGLPWAHSFVSRFNQYLDDFLVFPGYPGLPEREADLAAIPAFFSEAQRRQFDLAIQLHGSGSYVNSITVLLGARLNAGFYLPGEYCPDEKRFMPWPADATEVGTMLRLMEFLGAPSQGEQLEFPLTAADWNELHGIAALREVLQQDYVCLHPGARFPSRRWPPGYFAAVGDALAARGLRVVITGTQAEAELTAQVSRAMQLPNYDLAGTTSLGAMAALYSRARLLVANDTGVSHIASALGTPSLIVVAGSDPARWAPLDETRHRTLSHPIECRPCMHLECPIGHPCALSVKPSEVIAQAEQMLRMHSAHGVWHTASRELLSEQA